MIQQSSLRRYFQTLKWTPLPFGVGFALIAYQQYRHTRRREAIRINELEPCDALAGQWEIQAYKLLPLRTFSRTWGWISGLELPEWSRPIVLGSYAKTFGCNLSEAEIEDISKYKSLSEFFRRRLKINARPIHPSSGIVSPADGTVLYRGKVDCGVLEQVKGVSYSARRFLGPNSWADPGPSPELAPAGEDQCFHRSCLCNPRKNDLFHVAVYLAPGDYHRFHSPCDWRVSFRRHFPGELLSVCPSVASWVRDLFVLNERVCYVGSWAHGFFSLTAVGATNVGSIVVPFDDELRTNRAGTRLDADSFDRHFEPKLVVKGEDFGEFNLGSTIVLIFEAPKGSVLEVDPGQRIRVGQPLFRVEP